MIILHWVMKMFLDTKETIPAGVGFSTFGITHLLWLLAFVVLCVVCLIIYKKLDNKKRTVMRIALATVVFLLETVKNIVAYCIGDFGIGHLPFHLCGISVVLVTFSIFKRSKAVENFLYYIGVPGALLALLFPNWTVLPCLNFFHMHSFIVHMLLVLYPFLLVASGEIKPTLKDMPKCILLLVGMAIPIYFINLAFDTNFMFLMEPETGNPLGLFEKYLGSHLWGFPVLLPIVMFIMYLPIMVSGKIRAKKQQETEKEPITV